MNCAYLSLGSNISAEENLPKALKALAEFGRVEKVSGVWESESVGFAGPNFLNLCVLFLTELDPVELKEKIIRPIEAGFGRIRGAEKNAPRPIDIDIALFNEQPLNLEFWDYAFVIVPLAELIPDFVHSAKQIPLVQYSNEIQSKIWVVPKKITL